LNFKIFVKTTAGVNLDGVGMESKSKIRIVITSGSEATTEANKSKKTIVKS